MDLQQRKHSEILRIGSREFSSRLLLGTGKYRDLEQTRQAVQASGAELITVAIRRTNIGQHPGEPNLLDVIPPQRYTLLPNTAGCYSAKDAVRTCRLARELLDGHNLIKLEVLGDERTLYPNVVETLQAAAELIEDGFEVMVYTSDDPIIAKRLEELGCVAIMPLGSLIGSGMGIVNPWNILTIVEHAQVPVIVDAGVGTASDAAFAMELGCDGVLMNTAVAGAQDPVRMARAMRLAVQAGRDAYLAGRIPRKRFASASSPLEGVFSEFQSICESRGHGAAHSAYGADASGPQLRAAPGPSDPRPGPRADRTAAASSIAAGRAARSGCGLRAPCATRAGDRLRQRQGTAMPGTSVSRVRFHRCGGLPARHWPSAAGVGPA